MTQLEDELGQSKHLQESTQLIKPAAGAVDLLMLQLSKVKWGITLLVAGTALVLYLGVLGYRTWRTHQAADPLAELGPGLYNGGSNSGDVLPLAPPGH
jgi:hypothetical protein